MRQPPRLHRLQGAEAVPAAGAVDVSVVMPLLDEGDNVAPLLAEIEAVLAGTERFEVVAVDDGSADDTVGRLTATMAGRSWLRVIRHDRTCGQSAAIRTGVRVARGGIVVTIDGDGQNDPHDIPALLAAYRGCAATAGGAIACGRRMRRRDGLSRRVASRVANNVRTGLLGDAVDDTGCGLKAFGRDAFMTLPYFDHMHRFLPALIRREGGEVVIVPVDHRQRRAGRSKYGVWDRLWVGVADICGVWWLQRRCRRPHSAHEVTVR